jgi:hypothetical protein
MRVVNQEMMKDILKNAQMGRHDKWGYYRPFAIDKGRNCFNEGYQ